MMLTKYFCPDICWVLFSYIDTWNDRSWESMLICGAICDARGRFVLFSSWQVSIVTASDIRPEQRREEHAAVVNRSLLILKYKVYIAKLNASDKNIWLRTKPTSFKEPIVYIDYGTVATETQLSNLDHGFVSTLQSMCLYTCIKRFI